MTDPTPQDPSTEGVEVSADQRSRWQWNRVAAAGFVIHGALTMVLLSASGIASDPWLTVAPVVLAGLAAVMYWRRIRFANVIGIYLALGAATTAITSPLLADVLPSLQQWAGVRIVASVILLAVTMLTWWNGRRARPVSIDAQRDAP